MLVPKHNREPLVNFLLKRWAFFSGFAALERVYRASIEYAKNNGLPPPNEPQVMSFQPCKQIELIKRHIIKALPKASVIDYIYESPAPLDPNDFVELYVAEQMQCIDKVKSIMVS